MNAVLWGKLVLNLGNAINALAGLPLAEQFADRRWRRVLAAQIGEALAVMRACAIRPAAIGALRPALLPFVLRLPDFVFRIIARRMIAFDPQAKSSTLQDLERGRRTETGEFQAPSSGSPNSPACRPLWRPCVDRIRRPSWGQGLAAIVARRIHACLTRRVAAPVSSSPRLRSG